MTIRLLAKLRLRDIDLARFLLSNLVKNEEREPNTLIQINTPHGTAWWPVARGAEERRKDTA